MDSLRADAVHEPVPATPVLDALADEGAVFRQCVATATSTTPSFASMLTGCYLPKHGIRALRGHTLSRSIETTMPEAFRAAGYTTAAEVTGPLVEETGVFRGFDRVHHRRGHDARFLDWVGDVTARIRALPQPWFVLLHVWEAHRPYRPPPAYAKTYARQGYEAAVAALDAGLEPVLSLAGDGGTTIVTGDHGEVYAETWVGDRLAAAAREGRRRLRVGRWAPGLERKLAARAVGHGFTLDEELVRVPLILAGPDVPHRTIEEQVRHVDLFPTLGELLSLDVPEGVDGRSLVPALEGASLPLEPAYMECSNVAGGHLISGVRTPAWKLLVDWRRTPRLYALDGVRPDERHDLAGRHPDVVRELQAYMEAALAGGDAAATAEPLTEEEEAVVERHLKDLGYL